MPTVLLAGASGFLGGHLVRALNAAGYTTRRLVRAPEKAADEHRWDPGTGIVPAPALHNVDAVVNLCGAGVGDRRWTPARRRLLRTSRLAPTAALADACAAMGIPTLVNASAVGIYGDRGDETLTETAPPGIGFLARLCVDWEAATTPAAEAGTRVVLARTGLVLGPDGGMLPRLATLTRAMLGGRLGDGRQWWPWISVVDYVAAMAFALRNPELSGPVNVCAPEPVTNAEFTAALADTLGRIAPWMVPGPVLRAVLGGFATEILGGQRTFPAALTAAGFTFLHTDLTIALRAALTR